MFWSFNRNRANGLADITAGTWECRHLPFREMDAIFLWCEGKTMIYENVEFYNFDDARHVEGREGVLLQRIPENVRRCLGEGTQIAYSRPAGGEIRFVSDWKPVKLTLSCHCSEGYAYLYFGNFQAEKFKINEEPTTIEIPIPRFLPKIEYSGEEFSFSPMVRRLLLYGGEFQFISIEGEGIRPPERDETPKTRFISYGTSITHGVNATNPMLSYIRQCAWRLGADVLNYGASGNALCEKEIANYLAERNDWDFATVCISVNMLSQGFAVDEFREKARYFVHGIAEQNPTKPVVCISLFPFFMDRGAKLPDREYRSTAGEYREVLKQVVTESKLSNVHFVEGRDLLKNYDGLSYDLLHPGDLGMIQIGENLAGYLRTIL